MLGIASAGGRVGGMFAPLILELARVNIYIPNFILAAVCFVASWISATLPETQGKSLPQTTEEAKALYKSYK